MRAGCRSVRSTTSDRGARGRRARGAHGALRTVLALRMLAAASLLLGAAGCASGARAPATAPDGHAPTPAERAFLDTLSRRTFDFFWETTNPRNGLTPDRWPTKSFSSVAAVGF